jgi:sugar O-acyltransferase (sialic acid O-acetyltransferase NeuD family)
MTEDLVIVGAGGFARETAAAVAAVNGQSPQWRLLGFLDDNPALHGTTRSGQPVLGGTELLADLPDAHVLVCIVSPRAFTLRRDLADWLGIPDERFATVVHPSAQLAPGCSIGPGSVLLANVVLTADASLGRHVFVMPSTVITHDDVIEDYVTLTSGVRVSSVVTIGTGTYVGSGTLIREGVTIGPWSLVGMGAVVLRDVPGGQVWVGNPARYLRDVARPD